MFSGRMATGKRGKRHRQEQTTDKQRGGKKEENANVLVWRPSMCTSALARTRLLTTVFCRYKTAHSAFPAALKRETLAGVRIQCWDRGSALPCHPLPVAERHDSHPLKATSTAKAYVTPHEYLESLNSGVGVTPQTSSLIGRPRTQLMATTRWQMNPNAVDAYLQLLTELGDALQPPEEPVVYLGQVVDLVNGHRFLRKNLCVGKGKSTRTKPWHA